MSDGEYQIDEDVFKTMSRENQLWILYSTFNIQRDECDKRFCKIERQKRVNTAVAAGGGFIGGVVAVAGTIIARVMGWIK